MVKLVLWGCVADVVIFLLTGFALNTLWAWFIIPKFGLPPLGMLYAIGLSITAQVLTKHYVPLGKQDAVSIFVGSLLHGLITPSFALLVGWITHAFL